MKPQLIQQCTISPPSNVQPEGVITKIEAYQKSITRMALFLFLCVITGGMAYLLTIWYTKIWCLLRVSKSRFEVADYYLVTAADGTDTITEASTFVVNGKTKKQLNYRFYRYYYDSESAAFIPLELNLSVLTNSELVDQMHVGVTTQEKLNDLTNTYGLNSTDLPDRGFFIMLIEEVLNPFYIFQFFSIALWFYEDYIKYAIVIVVMSVLSIGESLYDQNANYKKLQALARSGCQVRVFRFAKGLTYIKNGRVEVDEQILNTHQYVELSSTELVPGDIVEIEENKILTCDVIILTGQAVMNEAMLTGESIPVIKSPLPMNQYLYSIIEEGKQSTVLAGTKCVDTKIANKGKIPVLGVVTQTGFSTLKGQLIRSIMFTQQTSFQFYEDSLKYIAMLSLLALVGFCITLPILVQGVEDGDILPGDVVTNLLDLITITVPPALPTSLQIGISIAMFRLKKLSIFCIQPQKINVAGRITVMCFDKTGTLTEEGLDYYGIRIVGMNQEHNRIYLRKLQTNDSSDTTSEKDQDDIIPVFEVSTQGQKSHSLNSSKLVLDVMACCHTLSSVQGTLIGDPLDIKLFEVTRFRIQDFEEKGFDCNQYIFCKQNKEILLPPIEKDLIDDSQGKLQVIRKFEFSSKLQRMSVITKSGEKQYILVKGSPEKLQELCLPQTVPASFLQVLEFYAQSGYRVLCCGARVLGNTQEEIQQIEREVVEKDLTFLGFLILENKLKPITTSIIGHLQEANVRTIMITGDNILTAISVARSCNIIKEKQRVYFAEIQETQQKKKVIWKNFELHDSRLDFDLNEDLKRIQLHQESLNDQIAKELVNEAREVERIKSKKSNSQVSIKPAQDKQNNQDQMSQHERVNQEEIEPWKNITDDFVLALSGQVFIHITSKVDENKELLKALAQKVQVYARMRPEDKGSIIKLLQTYLPRKPLVGFCGDGANDCNALKAADVGISLSLAEASIAAPFTSQIQDISCVPLLLREGRAALTTSFTCFKYMTMYSMMQFTTVILLYLSLTDLSDGQFLYEDLFMIIPLSMTMGFTHAIKTINRSLPKGSLLSKPVLASVIGQGIIQVSFQPIFWQILIYAQLLKQPWFIPTLILNDEAEDENQILVCYESTTLFIFSNFQYVFTVIAFSTSKPFRLPFYTNLTFTISLVAIFCLNSSMLIFYQNLNFIGEQLDLLFKTEESEMPYTWILFIAGIALLNAIITVVYERVIVPLIADWKQNRRTQQTASASKVFSK